MGQIRQSTLSSGLAVVTERIDGVASAAIRWQLPVGTARDPKDKVGLSAMIEELLMRGSGGLDSRAVADAFDMIGASRGTTTSSLFSGVSATLLGSRIPEGLSMLTAMVREPRFGDDSFEPSRSVCLQSIASLADDPQERVMLTLKAHHAGEPVNRAAVGTAEGIAAVEKDDPAEHWQSHAVPGGSILAVAGDVDHDAIVEQLEGLLSDWTGATTELDAGIVGSRGITHETQDSSQVHIALAYDGPKAGDADYWVERLGCAVLSGGMSGRLFTEVREKRGLCYSVYASYSASRDFGRTVAYVGTSPERAQESLDVLLAELRKIGTSEKGGPVTEQELQRARIGLKSKVVLSGESSSARANALVGDLHSLGRGRSLDEISEAIDAVELDALNEYLAKRTLGELTVATIGPSPLTAQL